MRQDEIKNVSEVPLRKMCLPDHICPITHISLISLITPITPNPPITKPNIKKQTK